MCLYAFMACAWSTLYVMFVKGKVSGWDWQVGNWIHPSILFYLCSLTSSMTNHYNISFDKLQVLLPALRNIWQCTVRRKNYEPKHVLDTTLLTSYLSVYPDPEIVWSHCIRFKIGVFMFVLLVYRIRHFLLCHCCSVCTILEFVWCHVSSSHAHLSVSVFMFVLLSQPPKVIIHLRCVGRFEL